MRKKLLACTVVLCAILFSLTVAHAAVVPYATPRATLDFNGTTATCSVRISAPGKTIKATMQLWQGNTLVDSWSGSGTSTLRLSETHSVTKGKTYTVRVTCTVNGSSYAVNPTTKTCP